MLNIIKYHKANIFTILLSIICFGPIVYLIPKAVFLKKEDYNTWEFLISNVLWEIIPNTFYLVIGVSILSIIIGCFLAFLIVLTNIPFKKVLNYLFILPISFPLYVLSFIYVGMFEYSGDIPTYLRSIGININNYIYIKSVWGIIIVFSLSLYPYVYILAKNAFTIANNNMFALSRSMGVSKFRTLIKMVIPYSRPWIIAGFIIICMEVLADFGGVSVFNYNTFTTTIYSSWFGLFSLPTAIRLSLILALITFILYIAEERSLTKARFFSIKGKNIENNIFNYGIIGKAIIIIIALTIVLLSSIIPITQMIIWALDAIESEWSFNYWNILLNTIILGIVGGFTISIIGFICSIIKKGYNTNVVKNILPLSFLGYSQPGILIAVAVFIYFSSIENIFNISWVSRGSIIILILGYLIRFLAIGFRTQNNAIKSIHTDIERSARSMGMSKFNIIKTIHFPLVSPVFFSSMLLSFIEIIKEMPITLILRPFNMNTLSVKIYELTSEGEWERASLAGVFLVLSGSLSIYFLDYVENKIS